MKANDKKAIYIGLWVFTNVLMAVLIGLSIELILTKYNCVLTPGRIYGYIALVVMGILIGLILAPIAWRKIYIEGLRGKKYVIKGGKQKLFL